MVAGVTVDLSFIALVSGRTLCPSFQSEEGPHTGRPENILSFIPLPPISTLLGTVRGSNPGLTVWGDTGLYPGPNRTRDLKIPESTPLHTLRRYPPHPRGTAFRPP